MTPARSWPAAAPAPRRARRRRGRQRALGGRDDLRRLRRVVRAGPDRRDVVGADHARGQLRVAQLLGRRDGRQRVPAGRLQAAAPGHREAAQQPDRRLQPRPGAGRHRAVVGGGGLAPTPAPAAAEPGVEVVGLVEDVGLQAAQARARVHAELLDQQRPRPAQHARARRPGGRRGTARAPAAARRPRATGARRRARPGPAPPRRPAEGEPRLGPPLDGVQPQLGQPGALGAGPGLVGELGVRGPAPPAQRLAPAARAPPRAAASAAAADRLLEPPGVDRVRVGAQRVARALGDQQPGRARAAGGRAPAPGAARRRTCARRPPRPAAARPTGPRPGGDRDDPAAGDEQPGQHRAVPRPLQRDGSPAPSQADDRPQHPERDPHA